MKLKFQFVFWSATVVVLVLLFRNYYSSFSETFYFVAMLLPVVLATSYFFNGVLVPEFLLRGRYWRFFLYSLYMLIVSLYLEMIVIFVALIVLASYSYANMSPVSSDIFMLTMTLYFFVLLFSFVQFFTRQRNYRDQIIKLEADQEKQKTKTIAVRANRQMNQIYFDDILYVESLTDYVKVYLENGTSIMSREPISKLAERLSEDFIRVHRSFIVNQTKISRYNSEACFLGEVMIPVSRSYRKSVMQSLQMKQ
jgi:membrane protein implicated in regulation of membrane protease activity